MVYNFRWGARISASAVVRFSKSRLITLAVSEIIEVDVLIAPLTSSSYSTVFSVAVAFAPFPFPPVIVTDGTEVYPFPGLSMRIAAIDPSLMTALANAWTPFAKFGALTVTFGARVYPLPVLVTVIFSTC